MPLPHDILQRSPEEAARRIALEFLEEARAASERLDDDGDSEALHDFRVAIRRTRSTLRAWRSELRGVGAPRRRALRDIHKATGAGRDFEVALEWLEVERPSLHGSHRQGFAWLVERLSARHREAMGHVREQVRARFDRIRDDLRDRLELLRVETHLVHTHRMRTFAEALAARARADAGELVRFLEEVTSAEDGERGHRARIECKRLRYLLEPLRLHLPGASGVVSQCKQIQDLLGDLHDAHVLRDELGAALEVAEAEHARRLHSLAREADEEELRREARKSARPGLLELTLRVQRRIESLFEALERDWILGGARELVAEVERLAQQLEGGTPSLEIERKYLLRRLPPLPEAAETVEIDQGWLPGDRLRERIRRSVVDEQVIYTRTLKLGRGISRIEVEERTTEVVFQALWPLTKDCRIRKRRHVVREGDFVWEIDEFLDRELCLAEVELASEDALPELPQWLADWLVREVTDDGRYTNLALAEAGDRAPKD